MIWMMSSSSGSILICRIPPSSPEVPTRERQQKAMAKRNQQCRVCPPRSAGKPRPAGTSVPAEHPGAKRLCPSGPATSAHGMEVPKGRLWARPLQTAQLAGAHRCPCTGCWPLLRACFLAFFTENKLGCQQALVGTQEEPSPRGTPDFFNAPKLMFGTRRSADLSSRRTNCRRITPGHDQLNPGNIQRGLNPQRAGSLRQHGHPAEAAPGRCCMGCSAWLPLISRQISSFRVGLIPCKGLSRSLGRQDSEARCGFTHSVVIQWVQAPKPGEKSVFLSFFLICSAQSTDTTDFLVT